jgi:hypothetical protein
MIKILPIPRQVFGMVWPHAAPHIIRGLTAATDTMLRDLIDDIVSGEATLWVIADEATTIAAFVTATYLDDDTGQTFIGVYGLGGYDMPRWAALLDETMADYARQVGASSVRFVGREAWSRVLPSARITGHVGREAIFERAVQ